MLSGSQRPNTVHQIPDNESTLTIPSDLVTMERFKEKTNKYSIAFATARIAMIVADVQEEDDWGYDW